MIVEGRRVGIRRPWLYPIFGIILAFAFTFPLFLLLRERVLEREGTATTVSVPS